MAGFTITEPTFEQVLQQLWLHYHGKTGVETINRLFCKHLVGHKPHLASSPPYLTTQNTSVTAETKPKQQFAKLAVNLETGPACDGSYPIVIVRYRGEDCLVDGNHRCRYWHRNPVQAQDEHTAYVVTVIELGT